MFNKGKRKFICQECGKASFFNKAERNHSRKINCSYCGSYFLEPAPRSRVKEEILTENFNRTSFKNGKTSS